jgi:hypothetical protein
VSIIRPPSKSVVAASAIPHAGQLRMDGMSSDDLPAQVCSSRDTRIPIAAFPLLGLDCPKEGKGKERTKKYGPAIRKPRPADGFFKKTPPHLTFTFLSIISSSFATSAQEPSRFPQIWKLSFLLGISSHLCLSHQ